MRPAQLQALLAAILAAVVVPLSAQGRSAVHWQTLHGIVYEADPGTRPTAEIDVALPDGRLFQLQSLKPIAAWKAGSRIRFQAADLAAGALGGLTNRPVRADGAASSRIRFRALVVGVETGSTPEVCLQYLYVSLSARSNCSRYSQHLLALPTAAAEANGLIGRVALLNARRVSVHGHDPYDPLLHWELTAVAAG